LAKTSSHDLLVLDNLSVGLSTVLLPARAKFIQGDFTLKTVLTECLHGIDVVIHLAALSGVIDSINDPRPSFEVNVAGTFQLLELAREAGIKKIICASSGGALLGDITPPISEIMPPSPLSPYGAS
jgi:UDP-glucose 4-epimerase